MLFVAWTTINNNIMELEDHAENMKLYILFIPAHLRLID